MQDVRIHRLSLRAADPIVHGMKTHLLHYPTVAELRALEAAARRERAREIARLLRSGARALTAFLGRLVAFPGGRRIGHA